MNLTDMQQAEGNDSTMPRIFFADGEIAHYGTAALAMDVYYGLGKGTLAAFRGAGDLTPVYTFDFVDKP